MSKSPKKKGKRTTTIERHTLITLSTAHVPETLATGEHTRKPPIEHAAMMTSEYGWLVNVDRDLTLVKDVVREQIEEPESIVDALKELLFWAKRRGADYVLFDSDGPVLERFAVYDW